VTLKNQDYKTIEAFGDEWSHYDQSTLHDLEAEKVFVEYFSLFPWDGLPENASGFDMGCGSGRWARWVAPRVGSLHCIDPSNAIEVAKRNLADYPNVTCRSGSVDDPGLAESSQDFGYSLGVLHHVPDTEGAIRSCVRLLKPKAPFLLYLYYAFDRRPWWFKLLWRMSDVLRRMIWRLPSWPKRLVTDLIALIVYVPLAKASSLGEHLGFTVDGWPLSYYRHHSLYTMRTDSRDRFGTPLEQRFTRAQIQSMMEAAGLERIAFADGPPYWRAIGYRSSDVKLSR
jgi:SAM-dependent methyltransferase